MTGDLHTHSIYDDGKNSLMEMAMAAEGLGLDYLGFSGHSFQPGAEDWCIGNDRISSYLSEAMRIKEKFSSEGRHLRIFVGLELDIFGRAEKGLDYVIGSAHGFMQDGRFLSVDESPEALKRIINELFYGDPYAMTDAYYDNAAKIPEMTDCDIVGHFDLVTKFNESCPLFDARSPRYLDRALSVMRYLAEKDLIFEINTGAISRGWRTEPYPDSLLLRKLHDMGGRITINSDSHQSSTIAYEFGLARKRAMEAGFESIWVLTEEGFSEESLMDFRG